MIDVIKCGDGRCPSRASCWRFCAPEAINQSYADFGRRGSAKCKSYWHVTDKQKQTRKPSPEPVRV